jgi:hypothetical protein
MHVELACTANSRIAENRMLRTVSSGRPLILQPGKKRGERKAHMLRTERKSCQLVTNPDVQSHNKR